MSDLEKAIDRLRKWAQVKGRRVVLEFGRHSASPHNPSFYLELKDYQTEQFSGQGNGGGDESLTEVINRAIDWEERQ